MAKVPAKPPTWDSIQACPRSSTDFLFIGKSSVFKAFVVFSETNIFIHGWDTQAVCAGGHNRARARGQTLPHNCVQHSALSLTQFWPTAASAAPDNAQTRLRGQHVPQAAHSRPLLTAGRLAMTRCCKEVWGRAREPGCATRARDRGAAPGAGWPPFSVPGWSMRAQSFRSCFCLTQNKYTAYAGDWLEIVQEEVSGITQSGIYHWCTSRKLELWNRNQLLYG